MPIGDNILSRIVNISSNTGKNQKLQKNMYLSALQNSGINSILMGKMTLWSAK